MGIFDNLFNRRKNQMARDYYDSNFATFTAYNPVFRDWNGKLYESELVRASVDTIARHISKLKIEYHGSAHPELINRLKKGICPFMTDSQFLYKTATMLYMSNTCFILPVLDNNLQTIGYYADIPEEWKLKKYRDEYWIRMKFADRSVGAVRLDEVGILTRFHYKDMLFGDSHSGLDETMKLLNIQRQAIEENVKNGATYRFWGQYMQVAKESDLEKERKRFTEKNLSSKADNSGMLLFPRDYDNIHQIENKPYSIDTSQMQLIKDNVYDFYGVNTDMIQNKASSEVMDAFFNGLIEPFAIQMGEVLRNLIFSYNERSYGNDVYLVANRLQYMSTSQKIQMARDFGDRGILSVNEIRELLNFAPRDDGDVTFIRGEYFTTDQKLTELTEAQTETEEEDGKDSENAVV